MNTNGNSTHFYTFCTRLHTPSHDKPWTHPLVTHVIHVIFFFRPIFKILAQERNKKMDKSEKKKLQNKQQAERMKRNRARDRERNHKAEGILRVREEKLSGNCDQAQREAQIPGPEGVKRLSTCGACTTTSSLERRCRP